MAWSALQTIQSSPTRLVRPVRSNISRTLGCTPLK
jgi:hypothetical protein